VHALARRPRKGGGVADLDASEFSLTVGIIQGVMHWSFHAIHAVEPAFLFDAAEITDVHYLARARRNSGSRGIRPFRGAAFDQRLCDSANRLASSCGGRLDPGYLKLWWLWIFRKTPRNEKPRSPRPGLSLALVSVWVAPTSLIRADRSARVKRKNPASLRSDRGPERT
jgi:hypothetical protein